MADDIAARDRVPVLDQMDQPHHRRDLLGGKGDIAPFVPRIDDLDADARRIDVADPAPVRRARVPCALLFGHHMGDLPILADDIMRRSEEHTSELQSLMRSSY